MSEKLTFFAEDSHASHFPKPGSVGARMMTVTSGLKCIGYWSNSGPAGLLQKMLLASSRWASTKRYLAWKPKTTPQRRLYFQLVPWVLNKKENESFLWPTPRASEWKGTGPLGSKSHKHRLKRQYLDATVQERDQASGHLNPTWVEWLQGFPLGWTKLKRSEMQSTPPTLRKLGTEYWPLNRPYLPEK